ncbi:MAG: hypothetical protein ACOCYO_03325, partial [Bacteroidota bacterium]
IGYFISDQQSPYFQSAVFSRILSFVQNNPVKSQIRESNKKLSLSIRGIDSIEKAYDILKKMQNEN